MKLSHICSLQFGDASGIQSPVSFGGFGSLTRHLGRLSSGIIFMSNFYSRIPVYYSEDQ